MIDLKDVDRVEVIDSQGRAFTRYRVSDVQMDIQDEGRTLKIFIASQWRLDREGGVLSDESAQ
jgi:hypothetical protein